MNLTPMDIHNKYFSISKRGYDKNQVDLFLDEIIEAYSDSLDQITDLENKVSDLENTAPVATEPTPVPVAEPAVSSETDRTAEAQQVSELLLSAQKSADLITKAAYEEAEKIITDAANKAQAMTPAAEEKAPELDTSAKDELEENIETLQGDYDRLKVKVSDFRDKSKMLLQKELEELDDENWQYWLDRYYGTERIYPVDGEPINVEPVDDASELDTNATNDVEFSHGVSPSEDGETIATGDNPTNVAVIPTPSDEEYLDDGPVIIFPEDLKK